MLTTVGRSSVGNVLKRGFVTSTWSKAADALVQDGGSSSEFLRFGNPVPSDVGMNQYLPHLPETKVR